MPNPYDVVKQFEHELAVYTGAKYAVTVTSCTMAILLAVKWHLKNVSKRWQCSVCGRRANPGDIFECSRSPCGSVIDPQPGQVEIPNHTYVGVPMSIVNAGGKPVFRDYKWEAGYQLGTLPVWDYARWFTSDMYKHITASEVLMRHETYPRGFSKMLCVSFHHSKILGLAAHGGAILHDNDEADEWLRRARFDGRKEGVSPKDDTFPMIGFHCYMTPATAAEGLMRLSVLPKHNEPLPWGPGTSSDYADLSKLEVFR